MLLRVPWAWRWARRCLRLQLPGRRRAGAETGRPDLDAHGHRLHLRRDPDVLLMGAFVSNSGMSRELFRAANGFVGHLRGGLGIATVAACGGFAAICGSSVATAATFSRWPIRNAPLRLSAIVRHRRDRGRRHLGRCCRRRPSRGLSASSPNRYRKLFMAGIIPACWP